MYHCLGGFLFSLPLSAFWSNPWWLGHSVLRQWSRNVNWGKILIRTENRYELCTDESRTGNDWLPAMTGNFFLSAKTVIFFLKTSSISPCPLKPSAVLKVTWLVGCFSLAGLSSIQWRHKLVDEIFSASMLYVMKFRTDISWPTCTSPNYVRLYVRAPECASLASGQALPCLVYWKSRKSDKRKPWPLMVMVVISDFVCSLKTRLAWVSLEVEVASGWPIKSV